MLEIESGEDGRVILSGRLDTAQCAKAQAFLDNLGVPSVLDFAGLDYISSAGLGVLLIVQKRAMKVGESLKIINVNNHIHDIFRFSGFDKIFKIERAST
ncbi:MAG: STAS domain-containing protein [Gammaproteobacteria bacterium]|nr:STAS domain-containing protein [Gammaproteobacteria bacterium]